MKCVLLLIIVVLPTAVNSQPDMAKDKIIKKTRIIDGETARVWEILTNPAYIEQWLATKVESKWERGSPISFRFSWNGTDFVDKGIILSLEQGKSFSYTYWSSLSGLPDAEENYSKITFGLDAENGSTKLTLTHTDFANDTMYEHSNKNWEESLDTIQKLAEKE